MLRTLLSPLIRPLYHLFIAGPSQACSRTSFLLALTYLYLVVELLMYGLSRAQSALLLHTGFPASHSEPLFCTWQFIGAMKSPATHQAVSAYVTANTQTLMAWSYGVFILSSLFTLFVTWRVFMLIFQRTAATAFPATWAAAITLAATLIGITAKLEVFSTNTILIASWLTYLACIPPVATSIPSSSSKLGKWFAIPLRQGFSFSFTTPLGRKDFAVAFVLVSTLPFGILLFWTLIAYIRNSIPYTHPLTGLTGMLCETVTLEFTNLLGHTAPRGNIQALVKSYAFIGNMFSTGLTLNIIYPVIFSFIWQVSIIFQRFRHINLPHSAIWATIYATLYFAIYIGLNQQGHGVAAIIFMVFWVTILALYKPRTT